MSGNHYKNASEVKLTDIFQPRELRLVPIVYKDTPCGYSEIPVEIILKQTFAEKLPYKVPWDGELYGFLRGKKNISGIIGKDSIVKLTISDWDDKFALIFEDPEGHEEPVYYISTEEAKTLFERCVRPGNF